MLDIAGRGLNWESIGAELKMTWTQLKTCERKESPTRGMLDIVGGMSVTTQDFMNACKKTGNHYAFDTINKHYMGIEN
jgi:short subunit dehydrogenase-like uncharacterized protein